MKFEENQKIELDSCPGIILIIKKEKVSSHFHYSGEVTWVGIYWFEKKANPRFMFYSLEYLNSIKKDLKILT